MKILILGVNGFIGSHLVGRILRDTTWEVYGMDLGNHKVAEYLDNPRFHFREGDISISKEWIEYHVKNCDVVLPLVAIATPKVYVTDPLRVFELDFEENLRIVRQCVKYKKRVVFPSTSEVYGMCPDAEFDEETSALVTGPIPMQRWIYSTSKQLLDRVIWGYGFRDNLQFTLFRPFNWMGPKLDSLNTAKEGSSRLVTQFAWNLFNGEPLKLVDGGAQRRCFCDVEDAMDGLMSVLRNEGGKADGKIFNIGNPANDHSVQDIAERMLEIWKDHPFRLERNIPLSHIVQETSGAFYGKGYQDVLVRTPSIRRMRETFGFDPKIGIKEALRKAIDFFVEEHKAMEKIVETEG
ncbi:bifunctional UDP-4-keto-pentose/UDP-xylose synthase [Geothrix sp. 21YS21S-2]|uniref:bifunctional UDP-4-keto-pentose/UDP-xylose synthase n=1 Tax=Geothrix sp. 21YS21S-2 TaxID=3068893 RepID=UPI001ED49E2D|nr:bifunctional UDP-4-keto-pentose/UDP-xylose synthase [Geothrix sp. 21YS21S-2]NTV76299.1 bifunctional UDP-4-keto-pentose/UDP-xylose synthase [Holophaga sp.]